MSAAPHEDPQTVIRPMQPEDVQQVIDMGSQSIKEGPYRDQLVDNQGVTRQLAGSLVRQENARVLVAVQGEEIIGIFAFVVFPHYFSGEITAGELMWYVKPAKRAGNPVALNLLWKAQDLARHMGAKKMQLTAPTAEIGEMYKRLRYREIETSYQKAL